MGAETDVQDKMGADVRADEVKSDKSLVDTCLGVQMQNFGVEFRDVNIGETKLCRMELIDH